MAPEQVRGETNRLDGRTDIWAIGVILYRGLTGPLPFRGSTTAECFEEILGREPRPPRQCGDDIPRELERICLRCLSRQMSDRYLTAADLADDLRRWLADARTEQASGPGPAACSAQGAAELRRRRRGVLPVALAGPSRGSDGLPESIRFWKTRIEAVGRRADLQRGRDLRSLRGRQILVREGRAVAAARPVAGAADPGRGEPGRHRGPAAGGASPDRSPASRRLRPGRRHCHPARRSSDVAAAGEAAPGARPVRAVAPGPPDRA